MNIFRALARPEYIFRPPQILKRIRHEINPGKEMQLVTLPWGSKVAVHRSEVIGSCICRLGLYDLVLTEVLWRLLRPGNVAVDVGANIGYTTAVMASRVGEAGTVLSIEPHPQLFAHLESNVALLRPRAPAIQLFNVAISDRSGITRLSLPKGFATNQGTASLSDDSVNASETIPVRTVTLDELMGPINKIDLIKIDVEGHEYEALLGGLKCIEEKGVTHVLFEDHPEPPTRVTQLLMDAGFSVFYLSRTFWGPHLTPLERLARRDRREAPNYLATRAGAQVVEVMSAMGWRCLVAPAAKRQ